MEQKSMLQPGVGHGVDAASDRVGLEERLLHHSVQP